MSDLRLATCDVVSVSVKANTTSLELDVYKSGTPLVLSYKKVMMKCSAPQK